MQSASVAQLVLQAVGPQANGEHENIVPPPLQLPAPSQVRALVSTSPLHDDAAQTVPAA
jgi:hypothetical protein